MEINIRKMVPADIPACLNIECEVFSSRWTESTFIEEIKTGYYLVAEINSQIVGFTGMQQVLDEAHITTVAVSKKYQGRGIGSNLVSRFTKDAYGLGTKHFYLEVRKSNAAAQRLYSKFGFSIIDIRKGYYSNPCDDAINMRKDYASGNM